MCRLRFKLATCRGTTAATGVETTVYMLVIEQAHDVTYSQQSIPLLSIASRITLKRYYTRLLIRSNGAIDGARF
jgi:hypothetical protein